MRNKKVLLSYAGLLALIVIIIAPVLMLYSSVPIGTAFSSWQVSLASLGKLTGLLGLSAFSMALFLSARFIWLDKLFYGLPKVINIHRWLGTISFSLIILHPLFLAFRYLPSPTAPLNIFLRWSEAAYLFGYISIILFMILVVMTFFWRMKYERLKSLHSLLAVPLMLGGIHSLLIDSDVKRIPILAVYFILLISISVLVYMIRLFLVDYGIKSKSFSIKNVEVASHNSTKITLSADKKNPSCAPGQFIFVSFPKINKGEEHPFSVADVDKDANLIIIAKTLGDFTAKLSDLKIGDKAMIDGPFGSFGSDMDKNCRHVWIAGGIGITPFISMAKKFASDNTSNGTVDLFYIVKKEEDLVEIDQLRHIEASCPRFKLIPYISNDNGLFNFEKLQSFVDDLNSCHFYICGPGGMMKYFVDTLKKKNIPNNRISIEAFNLL